MKEWNSRGAIFKNIKMHVYRNLENYLKNFE